MAYGKTPPLRVTARQLGLGSIDAQSRNIDWREAFGEDGDGWEIILPRVTFGDIAERAPDLLTPAQVKTADKFPDRKAPEDLAEEFEQSDGFYEWKDSFEPMMNYVWPAFLPYGMDSQDLADRIAEYCPTMTLIYFGEHSEHCPEEYGYALSGGGMNLADQIAAAYLCADQVPPFHLLQSLAGVIGPEMVRRIGPALRAAYVKAADHMRYRAKRISEERARVFPPKPKA